MSDPRHVLRRASEQYRKAEARQQEAKRAVVDALIAALRAGVPPGEVAEMAPFSPAYVRLLAREHGIPPAPRGGPGKSRPRRTSN